MKESRTFVRRTHVRRTKNPTWLEDVVLVHTRVLFFVRVRRYEGRTRTKVRGKIEVYNRVDIHLAKKTIYAEIRRDNGTFYERKVVYLLFVCNKSQ